MNKTSLADPEVTKYWANKYTTDNLCKFTHAVSPINNMFSL